MDKYLLEILKDVNTIIIPGLGALTITNADTGEIMFMPYLKHDDGKLSDYIAEKEGLDANDAKNLIAKYVREIEAKLDQGESYDMYEFGTFLKDDAGDVTFKNWEKGSEAKPAPVEEKKEEVKKEVELVKEATTPPAEEPKKEVVQEEVTKKEEKVEEPVAKQEEAKETKAEPIETEEVTPKEEKKTEEKTAPPVTPVAAPEKKEMNIAEKEELSKNVQKLDNLRKQKEEVKPKKKRGAGFYILIVLIVIIGAGGTYVGLNYEDVKQHIPFLADNDKEEETDQSEMDKMKEMMGVDDPEDLGVEEEEIAEDESEEIQEEVIEEEPVVEEEIIEEEPQEKVEEPKPVVDNSMNSGTPYHIVAGAFSSADNAERLAASLRDQGYPAKTFVRGSMTIVSLKSFSTNSEAATALSEAKSVAPKGWILYWK